MDTNYFKANGKGKESEFKMQIPQWLNSFIPKMQLSEPSRLFASSFHLTPLLLFLVSMRDLKSGELPD